MLIKSADDKSKRLALLQEFRQQREEVVHSFGKIRCLDYLGRKIPLTNS